MSGCWLAANFGSPPMSDVKLVPWDVRFQGTRRSASTAAMGATWPKAEWQRSSAERDSDGTVSPRLFSEGGKVTS
jgi:hypothetical protein